MANSKENANDEKPGELTFNLGDSINGFKLIKKIDEGGFGQVFKVSKNEGKTCYAMKIESNFQEGGSAIKLEINVLNQLPQKSVFPAFVSGGKRTKFHYLVLELLGDNLRILKSRSVNPESWSDGTWSRIGIQCFYAVKKMHEFGFVHRDLKPNNFAIGLPCENKTRQVYLFDFGLARKFVQPIKDTGVSKKTEKQSKLKTVPSRASAIPSGVQRPKSRTGGHTRKNDQKEMGRLVYRSLVAPKGPDAIPVSKRVEKPDEERFEFRKPRPHTDFRGTHQYASPNAHLLKELGRHDDIWSLMYMIAEFFVDLPWTYNEEIPVEDLKNQAPLLRIYIDEKNPGRLTSGMHRQLNEIDAMLKGMNYYDTPNYELVYLFLRDSMVKSKVDWDTPYDWEITGKSQKDRSTVTSKEIKTVEEWKNPKDFFKKTRWSKLPMPSISPPMSSRKVNSRCTDPKSVFGYKKADFDRRGRQMSKEDSANTEDIVPVKVTTPAQKSMKTQSEEVKSKKK